MKDYALLILEQELETVESSLKEINHERKILVKKIDELYENESILLNKEEDLKIGINKINNYYQTQ